MLCPITANTAQNNFVRRRRYIHFSGENESLKTLRNHLQHAETEIQTHLLDSESWVHSFRHATPAGTRQNVTHPEGGAIER